MENFCTEMYGIDFLLTHSKDPKAAAKVWILEIQMQPNLDAGACWALERGNQSSCNDGQRHMELTSLADHALDRRNIAFGSLSEVIVAAAVLQ
mmetsp:Transcript_29975/g.56030  ORF Transcript_29975/g.56030 Transcript_29975/m.56030 type:complete len:93 (+) Transcript_29975:269-547(+)